MIAQQGIFVRVEKGTKGRLDPPRNIMKVVPFRLADPQLGNIPQHYPGVVSNAEPSSVILVNVYGSCISSFQIVYLII